MKNAFAFEKKVISSEIVFSSAGHQLALAVTNNASENGNFVRSVVR